MGDPIPYVLRDSALRVGAHLIAEVSRVGVPVPAVVVEGEAIEGIEEMGISEAEKRMIFEENARRLLRLAI